MKYKKNQQAFGGQNRITKKELPVYPHATSA